MYNTMVCEIRGAKINPKSSFKNLGGGYKIRGGGNYARKYGKLKVKLKESRNRPGVAQRFPGVSMFHRAFFNSIIDKIPTHALFNQHCISLVC